MLFEISAPASAPIHVFGTRVKLMLQCSVGGGVGFGGGVGVGGGVGDGVGSILDLM
jgi:hypothetical protein